MKKITRFKENKASMSDFVGITTWRIEKIKLTTY